MAYIQMLVFKKDGCMKHHRKRWVRRNRHKQPSLIAMHRIAEFFDKQVPLIFND
jgi:hypothetical protein